MSDSKKICLVSDAWYPQVNGVVRTWDHVRQECLQMGHDFKVIHPTFPRQLTGDEQGDNSQDHIEPIFKTFAAPKYPEIKLSIFPDRKLFRLLEDMNPDAIHISTEGPLGMAARRYCRQKKIAFTSSYHTQYPYYIKTYFGIPKSVTWSMMRWFHKPASRTLVPTHSIADELRSQGFENVVVWTRGVDTDLFLPLREMTDPPFEPVNYKALGLDGPIFIYAGRIAPEKNLEAFLDLDLPGSKVLVGDGPYREKLEKRYPDVYYAGYQFGQDFARHYAGADVFVFPSLTDTYGVVMLEANSCGLPVAAFPAPGPIDVVQQGETGYVEADLKDACMKALTMDRAKCREFALTKSWRACAQMVLDNLMYRKI